MIYYSGPNVNEKPVLKSSFENEPDKKNLNLNN